MGNLTRDPESKTVNDKALTSFNLAVNNPFRPDNPLFIEVTAWGKVAENCERYLQKGSGVLVQGSLEQSSWETDSGERRTGYKVNANNVTFTSRANNDADDEEKPAGKQRAKPKYEKKIVAELTEDNPLDDIPF